MTKWASGQNEYSSFLGLKNTGFGQWVDRTFSKKKMEQYQAGMADAAAMKDVIAYLAPDYKLPNLDGNHAGGDSTSSTDPQPNIDSNSSTSPTGLTQSEANDANKKAIGSVSKVAIAGALIIALVGGYYLYQKNKK